MQHQVVKTKICSTMRSLMTCKYGTEHPESIIDLEEEQEKLLEQADPCENTKKEYGEYIESRTSTKALDEFVDNSCQLIAQVNV